MNSGIRSLMLLLCASFRAEVDAFQVRGYERALADIAEDVLLEAGDALIMKAASGTTYYPIPTPPQVLEAAAKIISQRRAQAAALHLGACTHDSHYEEIDGKLHRCSCWKRARLAMQAAGQPLTLPEVRHEDI
jgi:hypothetical protein